MLLFADYKVHFDFCKTVRVLCSIEPLFLADVLIRVVPLRKRKRNLLALDN